MFSELHPAYSHLFIQLEALAHNPGAIVIALLVVGGPDVAVAPCNGFCLGLNRDLQRALGRIPTPADSPQM